MTAETGFTTEGYAPFPSVYFDNRDIGNCSEWSDERIEDLVTDYWLFLEGEDIQPRARKAAQRVLEHLGFEMDYRYGAYDYCLEGNEDE